MFREVPIPADEKPSTINPDAIVTDTEAPYGRFANGNPRKRPKRDSDSHRNARMPAKESEAKAAAALLSQLNGIATMGVMAVGFTDTAGQITSANEGFEEMAYQALLTDPALCRTILKAGTTSGKVALLIAYGMLATSVAPVAITEYRDKRDTIRAARLEAEGYDNETTTTTD